MSHPVSTLSDNVCLALWVVDVERASIAWANCHAKAMLNIAALGSNKESYVFEPDFLATLRLLVASHDLYESVEFYWSGKLSSVASRLCSCTVVPLGGDRRGVAVQFVTYEHLQNNDQPSISSSSPLDADISLVKQLNTLSVAVFDEKGDFLEASDVFLARFGKVATVRDIFVTKSGLNSFEAQLHPKQQFDFDTRLLTLNGVRWHQLEVVFHPDNKILLLANDIHQERGHESEIFRLYHFDTLTGLPNRFHLYQRLESVIDDASKRQESCGILYLDLDNFKVVNDTFDHRIGDELIKQVALRIKGIIPFDAELYRLGGDEFVILLSVMTDVSELQSIANRVISDALNPYPIADMEMMVTSSIGIASYPEHGENVDHLLKNADAAMYRAKSIGHNSSFVFENDMVDTVRAHLTLGGDLRKAIEEQQFELYYQPKVRLSDEKTVGAEALIRWIHPELGMIGPDRFIPMAEENGLILPLGEWVIRTACQHMKTWREQGVPPINVSVNLSGRQFMQSDLVEMVAQVLKETQVDSQYLEFELTESMLMADAQQTIEKLHAFRKLGVTLSIDDFGTGYSSLAYLKKFPIQTLKIDRSFVNDLGISGGDDAIVKATIAMAKSLNLKVIAEGVENRSQIDVLNGYQCQEVQGFLFARPMSNADFTGYMRTQKMANDDFILPVIKSLIA